MNTPVKHSIAELLKEKGFDRPCYHYYYNNKLESSSKDNWNDLNGYSAPTITEVVMWLYEKYGIWISVETSRIGTLNYRLSKKEKSKLITMPFTFEVINAGYDFNSPIEAYEAAIEYTLNNLV